ncbi:MAG: ATP-dependent DNA helicase RecG [Candidatus Eremiobacteraeota bacterium]|nr:ATP-dependent DNA helicase RecG [Candidatus Eremiobacteraeota bacterium]
MAERKVSSVPKSLTDLRGVGPEVARRFGTLDIRTPAELAATYPRDYRDWRVPSSIADIHRRALARSTANAHESVEEIAVATVRAVHEVRARIPIVSAELHDGTGRLTATWFGRRGVGGRLTAGDRVFVHGRVAMKRSRTGGIAVEMNVLHHRVLHGDEEYRGAVVPVYPAGKAMPSRIIGSIIERNLDALETFVRDFLPPDVAQRHGYGSLRAAWREVHRPRSPQAAARARERIVFDEFFGVALAAALKRAERIALGGATPLETGKEALESFEASLPFAPTTAQRRVIGEVTADLARSAPMNRLLQGEVGSGKTLVAAAAIVVAARSGVQSALMAPTEVLAVQHARKLAPLLLPLGIRLEVVLGSQGTRARNEARGRLASGECDIAVGTHALLTENVTFRRLALAIIDEQHRFGVLQRARLRGKSGTPHTLYMTATPIPRTLAQTKYADLDLSVLDELPPGRIAVKTFVLRESRKPKAYEFVRACVQKGQQAFVVAPAIDEGEAGDVESDAALTSATAEFERLRRDVFPELRVGLLHGRMTPRDKDATMERLGRGEIDVLLATTVVEVGVDVPGASVMVVLDSHRYGLAQLHQLRGRVGRGTAQSFCLLIAPDGKAEVERLEVLARTNDGFEIAEEDLRLRRAGEFAGTAQAGGEGGMLGDVQRDFALYMKAKRDADQLIASDPELQRPEHASLRSLLDADRTQRATLVSS